MTTVDFDFFFRKTATSLRKLKVLAGALGATVMRPYYPASELYRVVRDQDGLQVDFMAAIHGLRSFEGVRDRASTIEIGRIPSWSRRSTTSSAASAPQGGRATGWCWRFWRRLVKKRPHRRAGLAALARESDRALRDMIRRWQALPPARRTNFLRKKVGSRGSAL